MSVHRGWNLLDKMAHQHPTFYTDNLDCSTDLSIHFVSCDSLTQSLQVSISGKEVEKLLTELFLLHSDRVSEY